MSGLDSSHLNGLSDPTDLPSLRSALAAEDPEGRLVPLGLDRVALGPEVVDTVADAVAGQLARAGRTGDGDIVVLVDATPIQRAGADLKSLVEAQLVDRFTGEHAVRRVVLRGHHPTLHADDDALDAATEAVAGAAAVVSVGGGTITDIAKVATARHGDGATADDGGIPLVVVQTAASVDGYTDNLSVVLRDGVKRTIPSRWPSVVLSDTTTIAQAPDRLTASGYGEVQSTFCAPADWYLASIPGLDDSFHPAPGDLVAAAHPDLERWPAAGAH